MSPKLTVCPPPAHQGRSDSLAAPAEAGQGVGTSVERFPAAAKGFYQFSCVEVKTISFQQRGLVSEPCDCKPPVLAGHSLQLLANELTDCGCCVYRHESGFSHGLQDFRGDLVATYIRAFAHLNGPLPSRDEVASISAHQVAKIKTVFA